jgi:hypothetical protein
LRVRNNATGFEMREREFRWVRSIDSNFSKNCL